MAQGDERTGEEGTTSISVVSHDEIRSIPKDRVVTYATNDAIPKLWAFKPHLDDNLWVRGIEQKS